MDKEKLSTVVLVDDAPRDLLFFWDIHDSPFRYISVFHISGGISERLTLNIHSFGLV